MLLNDHDVKIYGEHLKGKRIGFIVTGGIAAYTAPKVIRALRRYSCEVFPYVTKNGLNFVTEKTLAWASNNAVVTELSHKSEHLGQNNENFDAIVVYPATYDFIGKMSNGIADDCASSLVASHLAKSKIIYVPAMHGNMWDSYILKRNRTNIGKLKNVYEIEPCFENETKVSVPNTRTCVSKIVRIMSESSLKGVRILVTAGPTPVKIDNVRMITNRFSGKLGVEIANELYLRGAKVMLLQSYSGIRPPEYIYHKLHKDYDEYLKNCLDYSKENEYGVFSAAVADYKPKKVVEGKIPSRGAINSIELEETSKVIELVKQVAPNLKMISFKYEEGKSLNELIDIARDRLKLGHKGCG